VHTYVLVFSTDAFKKARQRMLHARENATKDLLKASSRTTED